MSTEDVIGPVPGVDPATAPPATALPATAPPATALPATAPLHANPGREHDEAAVELAAAVDELDGLSEQPVHTHAARYHEVHTRLQDALSDTDR